MYFSIPHCRDVTEEDGSVYTVYEMHLNGAVHCAVRYSQLHKLNEQIQKSRFDTTEVYDFPPKKLFSLGPTEKEDRRIGLELYVMSLGQHSEISRSNLFMDFLIQAQKEFNKLNEEEGVGLQVSTVDGKTMEVEINGADYSPEVLKQVAGALGIEEKYQPLFGLFLMQGRESPRIIRRLQDMECPFLTLKPLDETYFVELRRCYWNVMKFDPVLMGNSVTLRLLYLECIRAMEDRWIQPDSGTLKKLKQLKTAGLREQFVRVARTDPMYGFVELGSGTIDYPEDNSQHVTVYGGPESLKLVYINGTVTSLPVTRIRCWKLFPEKNDVIALEYLVMKDELRWVNISTTSQTVILVSMTLQAILDEMVMLRSGQEPELTKVRSNSGYLPISNKDRKKMEDAKPKAPAFSVLQNTDNELFMEGITDDDL
eukprot:sb/3464961/